MTQDVVATVAQLLRKNAYRFQSEVDLHTAIAEVLTTAGIEFEQERALEGHKDRLDFYLPQSRVGIEVKMRGAMQPALRQCERYLQRPEVSGLVLAAARHWAISRFAVGMFSTSIEKPFTISYLARPI